MSKLPFALSICPEGAGIAIDSTGCKLLGSALQAIFAGFGVVIHVDDPEVKFAVGVLEKGDLLAVRRPDRLADIETAQDASRGEVWGHSLLLRCGSVWRSRDGRGRRGHDPQAHLRGRFASYIGDSIAVR